MRQDTPGGPEDRARTPGERVDETPSSPDLRALIQALREENRFVTLDQILDIGRESGDTGEGLVPASTAL